MMAAYWSEFLAIALAHLLAVASPGPDFAIVTRQCVLTGTRAGVWTALGVGAGILLHVCYCLLGVALLLSSSPQLFTVMKLLAAAYLIYLGVRALRSSGFQMQMDSEGNNDDFVPAKAVLQGFLTNGLNPKATLFFLALFTVVIDPATPVAVQLFYGAYLAVATFVWFALLSLFLGHRAVRERILALGVWFDRAMGVLLILLALQIGTSFQG
jgi:RhtB (resistance to homoserine/threonine) family protein